MKEYADLFLTCAILVFLLLMWKDMDHFDPKKGRK